MALSIGTFSRSILNGTQTVGIRAFFEQLMIAKVADQGTFKANLNTFLEKGFIAKIQLTAIEHILESGHAAIHRGYKPVEQDLNTELHPVPKTPS
jgi:hypothetical protein